jgi:hypothetical protein
MSMLCHGSVLRPGQPDRAQQVAADPRALCRAHRPVAAVRAPAGAAGGLRRHAGATGSSDGVKGCNVTVPFKLDAFEAATTLHRPRRSWPGPPTPCKLHGRRRPCRQHRRRGPGQRHPEQRRRLAGPARRAADRRGRRRRRRAGAPAGGRAAPAGARQPHAGQGRRAGGAATRRIPPCAGLLQKTELLAQDLQGLQGNFDVVINASASSLAGAGVPVSPPAYSSPARSPAT